jgi:hypothetical protein
MYVTALVVATALALPEAAASQTPAPPGSPRTSAVEQIREELAALKEEYARRMAELEARLAVLEAGASPAQETPAAPEPEPAVPGVPPATTEAAVPPGAAGAGGPTGSLPLYGSAGATSKVFNPDIAVIGDFLGSAGENAVDPTPTLEMHEAEASFQAVVDPYARADFFLAFGPEGVEVEEGFLSFHTLPGGFLGKAGKLRAAFGRVNTFHNHVLPWADRPLVTRNLVGGEEGIGDAGISVSRLLPNPAFFLEATAEVYRGESELFQAPRRRDLTYLGRLRAYRDLTESVNLDLGGSFVHGHNDQGPGFTTRLFGVDATFRYRPLRRAIYRRLLARTELVWSRREQEGGTESAFGTYVSADYQFARRWFVGGRYDYSERAENAALADKGGSILLTFWPSEFSQVRAQLRRTRFAEGETATEVLFQLLFSIGAHGAHSF